MESWKIFNKFKYTFFQKKFGSKLERYFMNQIKKKKDQLHNELLFSPHFGFYKQFADSKTLEIMKN
jgi:hypothetical protein